MSANISYETMMVFSVANGDEAAQALVEKFTGLIAANAETEGVNEWGVRRLAYPIEDMNEAYYVLVRFKSEHAFPAELTRIFNITDGILRSFVLACEE